MKAPNKLSLVYEYLRLLSNNKDLDTLYYHAVKSGAHISSIENKSNKVIERLAIDNLSKLSINKLEDLIDNYSDNNSYGDEDDNEDSW